MHADQRPPLTLTKRIVTITRSGFGATSTTTEEHYTALGGATPEQLDAIVEQLRAIRRDVESTTLKEQNSGNNRRTPG